MSVTSAFLFTCDACGYNESTSYETLPPSKWICIDKAMYDGYMISEVDVCHNCAARSVTETFAKLVEKS